MNGTEIVLLVMAFAGLVVSLTMTFLFLSLISLYIQCLASGAPIRAGRFLRMKWDGIPLQAIAYSHINLTKGNVSVALEALEAHARAKGDLNRVTMAVIAAKKGNLDLSFEEACARDLAGEDILESVELASMASERDGRSPAIVPID